MRRIRFNSQVFIFLLMIFAVTAWGCQDCDEIITDARALKGEHQKCEAGDTCVVVSMTEVAGGNNCMGPFQCDTVLNEKNIDKFKSRAKELAEDYEGCDLCATASCAGISQTSVFCNEETGLCDAGE